ncbi:hypothetical protein [Ammoniphilus resinae]|uniref:Uncharacterized protein n=1 Tax=Ammoniphilus resinae TaxID=861532 RepID=A0ABS4GUK9_9BACL|nr:hypothetical protein [Ammoniphilus resinae]MBP1933941.1 hypothetical protein [Ammoniphilus resinae]
MEVLSRVEKNRQMKHSEPGIVEGIPWMILYIAVVYAMLNYLRIPTEIRFLQTMEISLFFSCILFLDLYLLAFAFITGKSTHDINKVAQAKIFIIFLWVICLIYHFALWILIQAGLSQVYFYFGLALTLGALMMTLSHFTSYFYFVKRNSFYLAKGRIVENRKEAYENLKQILYMYHLVQDVSYKSPEVKQMLRWNHFDTRLEHFISEVGVFVQETSFTQEDLDKLTEIKAWVENLVMIIGQHPLHKDLMKQMI